MHCVCPFAEHAWRGAETDAARNSLCEGGTSRVFFMVFRFLHCEIDGCNFQFALRMGFSLKFLFLFCVSVCVSYVHACYSVLALQHTFMEFSRQRVLGAGGDRLLAEGDFKAASPTGRAAMWSRKKKALGTARSLGSACKNCSSTVAVLDLTTTDAALKGFPRGFTDGPYGYVVPYNNGACHGKVARFSDATLHLL